MLRTAPPMDRVDDRVDALIQRGLEASSDELREPIHTECLALGIVDFEYPVGVEEQAVAAVELEGCAS